MEHVQFVPLCALEAYRGRPCGSPAGPCSLQVQHVARLFEGLVAAVLCALAEGSVACCGRLRYAGPVCSSVKALGMSMWNPPRSSRGGLGWLVTHVTWSRCHAQRGRQPAAALHGSMTCKLVKAICNKPHVCLYTTLCRCHHNVQHMGGRLLQS